MSYSTEKNAQIVVRLLKAHGIRHVIASPGTTNMTLVASIQDDPDFTLYSAVDERSAAYMACGLAMELNEPVVLSCTGATASRNYIPAMTEAYYRKLPILAITSTHPTTWVGHLTPQVTDRQAIQNDACHLNITLPVVKDDADFRDCELKTNTAILALKRHGGQVVQLNLQNTYSNKYTVETLPECRVINRITMQDSLPELQGKVGVFVGAHKAWSASETEALENFCAVHDAVVFCDHTSSYTGKHRLNFALAATQEIFGPDTVSPDVLIHIGEISGDYDSLRLTGKTVWRVSPDGEIRDTFHKLRYVFEMSEETFFRQYSTDSRKIGDGSYFRLCADYLAERRAKVPELPFSNIWVAQQLAPELPAGSCIHFAILNSLRSWNLFDFPKTVTSSSNVGGFGIDGCLSSLVGASLAHKDKLYYMMMGDLAFFYDMNVLGNRHVGRNLRILLINNGRGTEFTQYNHLAMSSGAEVDPFIAAAGHFGKKSPDLVRHYAEDLGFEYLSASDKASFDAVKARFLAAEVTDKPMLLEVFTDSALESEALHAIKTIDRDTGVKHLAKSVLGAKGISMAKKVLGRD